MTIILAGDIGGTKTILSLFDANYLDTTAAVPQVKSLFEQIYPSQNYIDLVPIVKKFLQAASQQVTEYAKPEKAAFGIAGPVVNNSCELTNLSWSLDSDRLQRELDISPIKLINDFAAIGYGVVSLSPSDLHILQPGKPDVSAPRAVIGAGTGLGEGFVIPLSQGGGYQVFFSEGGHTDFAPRSELEFHLLGYLRELYNITRVSVERVVSGMGITAIYQFLRDHDISQESPEIAQIYHTWKQEIGQEHKTVDLAAEVSKAALAKSDYLSVQTMKIFVEAYGAEAGNLALKLLPYGGLYVAGGIAAKILPLIQEGNFIKALKDKGRVSPLLEQVPVSIVLNPQVGLIGAALCATQI